MLCMAIGCVALLSGAVRSCIGDGISASCRAWYVRVPPTRSGPQDGDALLAFVTGRPHLP